MNPFSARNLPINGGSSSHQPQEALQEKSPFEAQYAKLRNALSTCYPTPIHPENAALCERLLHIFDVEGQRIDFARAGITASDMERLNDKAWAALGDFAWQQEKPVSQIFLPSGLQEIPGNLHRLLSKDGKIDYLSLPGFKEETIDLGKAGIQHCDKVDAHFAERLRMAHVPVGCDMRVEHAAHGFKIFMREYVFQDGVPVSQGKPRSISGRIYAGESKFVEKEKLTDAMRETIKGIDLNGKVQFNPPLEGMEFGSEKNKIVCRHWAWAWIFGRIAHYQAENAGAKFDVYGEMFRSVEQVQQSIPTGIDKEIEQWLQHAPVKHDIQPLTQCGKKLDDAFQGMQEGEFRHFFITSGSNPHAMAFELERTKAGENIVRFYEPKNSMIHSRMVERKHRSFADLSLHEFIPDGEVLAKTYFGEPLDKAWFHMVSVLPKDKDKQQFPEHSVRSLDVVSMTLENAHSSAIFMMALFGFHKELQTTIDALVASMDIGTLKNMKDKDGMSLLYLASQKGYAAAVKGIVDIILAADLEPEEKMELLTGAKQDGTPAYLAALYGGNAEIVAMIVDALLSLDVETDKKLECLSWKSAYGASSGFFTALQMNRAAVAKAMATSILAPGKLSAEHMMALLGERGVNGKSELLIALECNHGPAVITVLDTILESNQLSFGQKKELLAGKEGVDIPPLFGALEVDDTGAVQVLADAILQSNLRSAQKRELLEAKNDAGTPGLSFALYMGNTEAVRVFVKAVLSSNMDDTDKLILLEARNSQDEPGVSRAEQEGHHETAKVLMDMVVQYGKFTPEQMLLLRT